MTTHHKPGWKPGTDRRLTRLQRPEFEAVLWELAPVAASADAREKLAAHDAIMAAFDRTTGRRTARVPKSEETRIRAGAEAARLYAVAANGDTPAVTAGRRAELEAALNSLPPGWRPRKDIRRDNGNGALSA